MRGAGGVFPAALGHASRPGCRCLSLRGPAAPQRTAPPACGGRAFALAPRAAVVPSAARPPVRSTRVRACPSAARRPLPLSFPFLRARPPLPALAPLPSPSLPSPSPFLFRSLLAPPLPVRARPRPPVPSAFPRVPPARVRGARARCHPRAGPRVRRTPEEPPRCPRPPKFTLPLNSIVWGKKNTGGDPGRATSYG